MTTESRSRFTQNYVPGLFACAAEAYKRWPEVWREICVVKKSTKAYEESTYKSGYGTAAEKVEGGSITYDARVQGYTKRWVHTTKGLGARITEECVDDDLYGDMQDSMTELGLSLGDKKHVDIVAIFNTGFDTLLSGDSQYIFDTDHVRLDGSTYSNDATAADLSHSSLWSAIEAFEDLRDQKGKRINRKPRALLIPAQLEKKAAELLYSEKYPYSAENRINSLRRRNLTLIIWHYLSDSNAWFLLGEKDENFGLIHFIRKSATFAKDSDFSTGDALFKGIYRDSTGVNSPMSLYGNAGSS